MISRLLQRSGHQFILLMMVATRVFGTVGGLLVIYYVEFTMQMPYSTRVLFRVTSLIVVAIACVLTVLMALTETRSLRQVLRLLHLGKSVDTQLGSEGGKEAIEFAAKHHRNEAWLVPCSTWIPVLIVLRVVGDASVGVLVNITIAVFMAISMALMAHFFATERCMKTVVRYLLESGITIDYASIKPGRLRFRMRVCFTLIIATTALMIGTVASQRAAEMIANPHAQEQLVHELRYHSVFITLAALVLGIVYSTTVGDSVATRVSDLVTSIDRVGSGDLTERALPTGNDEIDVLARRFNRMVEQTAASHQTIRELNANLEQKVSQRTQELNDTVDALRETQLKLTTYNEKLERARADAESANNAKSTFLANISHELRTPLNGIIGLNDLLRNTNLDTQQIKYVDSARTSGETLLDLLNDLLDFSKIEAGKLELEEIEFDVIHVVESVMNTVAHRCKESVELICSIDPALPARLVGDPGRLRQILTNLANNALKFTDEGEILVAISCLSLDERTVELQCEVADSGIGISEEHIERIFDAFTQADASTTRKYGGTGLGLGICKQLCEMMDGEIRVTSEMGKGSRFVFTANLKRATSIGPVPIAPTGASKTRVLVVDRNNTVCEALRQDLAAMGIAVDVANSASNAGECLSTREDRHRAFQLVFLDMDLAEAMGDQLNPTFMDEQDETIFVAMIPLARNVDFYRLRQDGFTDYLSKPTMPSEIHRKVFEALGRTSTDLPESTRAIPDGSNEITPERTHRAARILLAEDQEINQLIVTEMLSQAGYECNVVSNGVQAVESLEREVYDLVLMDCHMPEMDGLEATKLIRQKESERQLARDATVPIVALTANAMVGERDRCLDAGMSDYLSKPIRPQQLLDMVEQHLQHLYEEPYCTANEATSAARTDSDAPQENLSADEVLVVDFECLVERCGGKLPLAKKLLSKFKERLPKDLNELQATMDAGDAEGLAKAAHALKGVAASLSAESICNSAAALEEMGRSQCLDDAQQHLAALRHHWEVLHDFNPVS